jgi:uncharacterized protein (DUF58 family)
MPRPDVRKLPDWKTWLRTSKPLQETAHLGRRYIYILPTRQGLLYALILIAMLAGAINYTLSLGFVLTFLLASLGVVAMLHTWRNLAHLELAMGKLSPVFAGEQAYWEIVVSDPDGRERYAITLTHTKESAHYLDISPNQRASVTLPLETRQRGWLRPGRLTVSTEFPLGLFHAWSYVEFDARLLVYPRPATAGLPLPFAAMQASNGNRPGREGDEDFSGLRTFQQGDSPKRIDWKASAREQGLLTKQFQGMSQDTLWLDWSSVPGNTEQRLSQLTRWLLDARDTGQAYGLRLPQLEIPIGSGDPHEQRCLKALALFGERA